MTVQTVDVYTLGPYSVPVYDARSSFTLDCLLPSSNRSYCVQYTEQPALLAWLQRQITGKTRMRFIVSGTAVNIPVYLTGMEYGEQDGTNDLYATLTLQPYATLAAPVVQAAAVPDTAAKRETAPQQTAQTTYTVKDGDNLWNICRRFYGDGSLCYKLAAYNGIQNANLIHTGQLLKIPDAATLGATAATTAAGGTTTAAAAPPFCTVRITMSGTFTGYAAYSYIDSKSGKSVSGEVKRGITLQVSKRSSVTVRWRSGAGCYCDEITINERRLRASGDSVTLKVVSDRSLDLHWTR